MDSRAQRDNVAPEQKVKALNTSRMDRHFRQQLPGLPPPNYGTNTTQLILPGSFPFVRAYGARTLIARCGMKWSVSTLCLLAPVNNTGVNLFAFSYSNASKLVGGSVRSSRYLAVFSYVDGDTCAEPARLSL